MLKKYFINNIIQIINTFFWMLVASIISIIIYDNAMHKDYNELRKDYNAAVTVIKQVEQDEPDYFYDVLIETDVYNKFKNK